jgi:voltage-gated potassium channel
MSEAKNQTGNNKTFRERISGILENSEKGGKLNWFDWFLFILIILNIFAVIVSSVDEIYAKYKFPLDIIEGISIVIFIIEFFLRLWVAPKMFLSTPFLATFDLLAWLPSLLLFVFGRIGIGIDLRILRILRLSRLLRVIKLFRYDKSFLMITKVLRKEKDKLFATIFIMVILILFASSMMYLFEIDKHPDNKFSNLPATLWWAVATLTTVGYGDVVPFTMQGKILGGIIAVLGIGLVAMPSGILAMGLIQQVRSLPHNSENIYSVLNFLESKLPEIKAALEQVQKARPDKFKLGEQKKDEKSHGYSINGDYLFFGWNLDIAKDYKNVDYVFSLAIQRKTMKEKIDIDKKEYPYIEVEGKIYV